MKKLIPFLAVLALLLSSLACNFGAKPKTAPTPVETDACCLNQAATPEPAAPEQPAAPAESPAPQTSGLAPGMYAFTNANVVRDLVVYKGVIHAATLGGLITWRLDSGYPMRYTPLNGMGHVSATSLAYCEIPEPRIIVGTQTGISVYDPTTGLWEKKLVFPAESRVETSKIDRLYCDQKNNRLLIGYNGLGVLELKTGDFQRYTKDQGLLWESISDITVNGKDIWIASGYKGIAQISGGKVKTYSAADGMPDERAYSLAFAKDGTLWVGASSGIQSFKGGKWTLFGSDSAAKLGEVNEIEIAADGKVWATTLPLGTGRLCQFNPKTAACEVDFKEMDQQGIFALTLTETGAPVYGTNKGVYLFENGTAKAFKTDDQLASNYVDSFASAPDGKLWVGTDAGIQIIDPANPTEKWTTFRQAEIPEMGGNWGKGLALTPDALSGTSGTAWVAFTNGSASRYQNGAWTAFKDIYSFDTVTVDAQGRAWFGDDSKGILVLNPDGSKALKLTTAEGLPSDNIQALVTDLNGRVWIGTNEGLAKYEKNALEVVFSKDSKEIPNKYIRALAVDSSGALVIGTFTGVARYDGAKVEVLVDFLKDGFSEARLTTLAVAPTGRVWIGTDQGLLYSDNFTQWTRLTTEDGLLTNYISALHVDQYGAAWIGGGGSNFDGGGMLQFVP
jgi:ligand-binding sensor domain-containing protein